MPGGNLQELILCTGSARNCTKGIKVVLARDELYKAKRSLTDGNSLYFVYIFFHFS